MARIGMRYPCYKTATARGVIGKAVSANISIELDAGELYGDDELAEEDRSFKKGTITLNTTDLPTQVQADLLGHSVVDGEMVAKADDKPVQSGVGFFGVKQVNNVRSYRAIWFPKVVFGEPNDEHTTKGESISFGTPTIVGTIYNSALGWKREKTFATAAEAQAWLNAKAEITAQVAKPVPSVAAGSYDESQTVALSCATGGATIHYTTNGLTPTADDTSYSTALTIAASTMLKAIAVKTGMSDSEVMEAEYIIS